MTGGDLEKDFDEAMMNIYRRAKSEADYNATRYLTMLVENRGLRTARILLDASEVSEGYLALWDRGRLDLTVEALILEEKWHPLFSPEERNMARERLKKYEYAFKG